MIKEIIEKKSDAFRRKYGISEEAAFRTKSLLTKLDVLTVFRPLGQQFSGMAIKVKEGEQVFRFMLVNSQSTIGKQNFTICHELYHLYVQDNFEHQVCITGKFDKKADKEEYNADLFAAYLLMPKEGILALIPEQELKKKDAISLSTVVRLEQYLSCSRSALLYRLKELDLISSSTYDFYATGVKHSALERGYGTSLYEPGNEGLVIGGYGEMAKALFDQEKISESHYHSLLMDIGVDVERLMEEENGEG